MMNKYQGTYQNTQIDLPTNDIEITTPKKPNERYYENYYCPKCHKQVFKSWKECKRCNKKLDWSEEE